MKVEAHLSDVARASCLRTHRLRLQLRSGFFPMRLRVRESETLPAAAGETPALRPVSPKDLTFMSRANAGFRNPSVLPAAFHLPSATY
jgi:hypothetical protein